MELAAARDHIRQHLGRMAALYQRPVFDEWAVLSLEGGNRGVLAYAGPRPDSFRRHVMDDAAPLRVVAADRPMSEGDFEFAAEAQGTRYDALMKLGVASYLVCNHTGKTMADIRADPTWLKAQAVFFELGEKFRADPLVI